MFRRCCPIASLMLACAAAPVLAGDLTSLAAPPARRPCPGATQVDGVPLGGLSGLTFDARPGRYLALSDDRSERTGALLPPGDRSPGAESGSAASGGPGRYGLVVTVEGATTFWRGAVRRFPDAGSTPRASRLRQRQDLHLLEGEPKVGSAPFVQEFDLDGRFLRELPLPIATARRSPPAPPARA